jgi:hypothetical protein
VGWLARAVIVLVVFPVIGHAIYTVVTWLLTRVVLPLLTVAEGWSTTLHGGVFVTTLVVAALGSWNVCRRLWPSAPVRLQR